MRVELIPHSSTPAGPVRRIEVDVVRTSDRLALWFCAEHEVGSVVVPPPAEGRADELWRETCFEAFVRAGEGEGYLELNVSPSGRWQAYAFDGERRGMRAADLAPPDVRVAEAPGRLAVAARIELAGLLPADADWRLALSAVVRHADGETSYWALKHAADKPDFHHPDSFDLTLPAEDAP